VRGGTYRAHTGDLWSDFGVGDFTCVAVTAPQDSEGLWAFSDHEILDFCRSSIDKKHILDSAKSVQ